MQATRANKTWDLSRSTCTRCDVRHDGRRQTVPGVPDQQAQGQSLHLEAEENYRAEGSEVYGADCNTATNADTMATATETQEAVGNAAGCGDALID